MARKTIMRPGQLDEDTLQDADKDTKIQVEESADEDRIRFDTAGSERMIIDNTGKVGIGISSPGSPLHVYGNLNGTYIATIDNDENSSGHGLKVTSDGSGTNTNLLDVESGSTTVFRVRADGKVAIGETSAGGIPTQVEALTVNGDLSFRDYLKRRGDADTYIGMPANDQMQLVVGGVNMIAMTEDDSQDKIVINDGAADVDFIVESPNEPLAIYLHAGNEILHINYNESAFKTKIHNQHGEAITVHQNGIVINDDGHATNDFRIESDNDDHMFFVDSGNNKIGIGTSSPSTNLHIASTGDAAIFLEADTDNSGETDNAYIKFSQDGGLITAILGTVGDVGKDSENNNYTDTLQNTTLLGTTTNYPLQFGTNDNVRMTILNDGKVGIGTAAPAVNLDVAGTGKFSTAVQTALIEYTDGDDAITIDDGGYLKFHQGVKYSRGVQVNTVNDQSDDSPDLRWIKIARTQVSGWKSDTSSSSFLVHTVGYESSGNRTESGIWLIHAKYTPSQHTSSGEHGDPDGTWIVAEPLHADDLEGWDPTTNLALTFDLSWTTGDANETPFAEIWFKTPVKDKEIFVTHLGGTGINNSSSYTGPGFVIQSGQSWAGSRTDLGSGGVGTKAQVVLTIGAGGGSDSTMPVDSSTMTIGTIYRLASTAAMIVRFTSGGASDKNWQSDGGSGNIDLTIHTDDVNTNDCQKIANRIQEALVDLQTQGVNDVVMYNHDITTGGSAGARTVTLVAAKQWSGSTYFTIAKDVIFTYAESGDSNNTLAGVAAAGTPPNVFMGIWASKRLGNITAADVTVDEVKTNKLSSSSTEIAVSGALKVNNALHYNVRDVNSTSNILSTDHVLRCIQNGAITLTLPSKSGALGQVLIFKDMNGTANSNNITVDGNGGETIDGSATYVINRNKESVTMVCDGINGWMITSRVRP